MAVTVANVTTGEVNATSADLPMFVGNNVLEDSLVYPSWRDTGGNWTTGSDVTDPNFPVRYAYDRQGANRTAPIYNAAAGTYWLILNLNPGSDGLHTIDTCMIWNHNLATFAGAITVTVQVADDNAFSTNLRTLVTFSVGSAQRLWSYSLGSNNRYSTVQWARVTISTNQSNFGGVSPAIGELFLGRRRQMSYPPDVPWENKGVESDVVDYKARSGLVARYVRSAGRRVFDPTMRSAGVDSYYALNQENELRSFWKECNYGAKPFIYCANPTTNNFAHVMLADPPVLNIPILGPYERECRLHMVETAPYVQSELTTYPH